MPVRGGGQTVKPGRGSKTTAKAGCTHPAHHLEPVRGVGQPDRGNAGFGVVKVLREHLMQPEDGRGPVGRKVRIHGSILVQNILISRSPLRGCENKMLLCTAIQRVLRIDIFDLNRIVWVS